MTTAKNNKSFLLQTVVAKNSSWNSDFNHSPKIYEDTYFASDRALKFAVRQVLEQMGKRVFIKKHIKSINAGKKSSDASEYSVKTSKELKEDIEKQFGKKFHEVFWDFEDIRHFGMVYDGLGLHGVAQISQGIDLYGQGNVYTDDLTGRMVFESKSDKNKETRGMANREFLTEAHFVYEISVNPNNVKFLQDIPGYEHCVYAEEDYETLLEALQEGPANVKSTQKMNCYTGFFLRVEMNDGEKTLLSDLQGKLSILPEKVDGKMQYDLTNVFKYLKEKQEKAGNPLYKEIVISYDSFEMDLLGVDTSFCPVTVEIN